MKAFWLILICGWPLATCRAAYTPPYVPPFGPNAPSEDRMGKWGHPRSMPIVWTLGRGPDGIEAWFRPIDAYVTCRGRTDGGGAQIIAQASTMIYARLRGLGYAHSPLTDVEHAPAGTFPASASTSHS